MIPRVLRRIARSPALLEAWAVPGGVFVGEWRRICVAVDAALGRAVHFHDRRGGRDAAEPAFLDGFLPYVLKCLAQLGEEIRGKAKGPRASAVVSLQGSPRRLIRATILRSEIVFSSGNCFARAFMIPVGVVIHGDA